MAAQNTSGEQRRLTEFARSETEKQCQAYADSTGEQCQRDRLQGIPYCPDHKHLLDEIDLTESV